jgi:hypothetical protein
MAELIIALLTWIGVQTGLAVPRPPAIVLLPQEQMSERAFGRMWQPRDDLRAFYDRLTATVYPRIDWSASDLRSRAKQGPGEIAQRRLSPFGDARMCLQSRYNYKRRRKCLRVARARVARRL